MFTALRRFSVWMTMIGEQFVLGINQPFISQASVYLMVVGALIASSDDLTFNWFGYLFLTINNVFTMAQGVVIKQKLINKVSKKKEEIFQNQIKHSSRILIKMVFYSIIH